MIKLNIQACNKTIKPFLEDLKLVHLYFAYVHLKQIFYEQIPGQQCLLVQTVIK